MVEPLLIVVVLSHSLAIVDLSLAVVTLWLLLRLSQSLFTFKNGDEERAFFKQYLKLAIVNRVRVGIERLGKQWSELSSTIDQLAALASVDVSFFSLFLYHS